MEEWKQDKLIDLLDSLIDYRGKTPRKVDKGIPLITAKIVKNGRIDTPTEFLDIEDYDNWMVRGFPKNGDVILTTEAPLGEVAQLDDNKIALAQRIVCLRGKEGVLDNTFLKYFLLSSLGQARLKARETGTTVTGIKQSELKEVLIDYPPYKYQKQITSILKSFDDKIELNRRINENLEQQAQALFKSWFIDFEPFKDGKFVDSELGMIPEELTISHIGDIPHTIESGRRPKGGAVLKGVPSIGAENIKGLGYYDYSKTKYIPEDFALTTNRGKINGYELLIYKDGGKPGYFIPNYTIFGEGFPFDEMFINEHVFRLDLMSKEYNVFAYFYMQTPYIMNQLNSIGGKAAIPGINTKDVESLPIFTENNKKIKEFGNLVLPMITTILRNCRENARLAQLRDTLLPRLMSGELKISDIENKKLQE